MKKTIKVIYFCFEYYCHHGARTHARSFFNALSAHPHVSKAILFPARDEKISNEVAEEGNIIRILQAHRIRAILFNTARMVWRNCVPEWFRTQIVLFYAPPKIYRSLSTIIRDESPDAIILRTGSMFRLIQRLRQDFSSLKICIEFNATLFDESKTWIPGRDLWRREEARQLGFADSICVVSEYLHRYLLALNPELESRIVVNPNGVDPEMFEPLGEDIKFKCRREMNIPDGAVVFGYIGGMEYFRRLPDVVRQISALRRRGLDRLFLVIIGTGDDSRKVSDAIRECSEDLSGWIYFCNLWVEHERIPYLVAAFDVGIFPYSNSYGAPQKILEYMSCALPVIGPDVPAVTEQFDKEYLPFLVKQDGCNFFDVFRDVYINLESCKTIALRARNLVECEFTWVANATRVVNAIIK